MASFLFFMATLKTLILSLVYFVSHCQSQEHRQPGQENDHEETVRAVRRWSGVGQELELGGRRQKNVKNFQFES